MKVIKQAGIDVLRGEIKQGRLDLSSKTYDELKDYYNLSEVELKINFDDSIQLLLPEGDTQDKNKDYENCLLIHDALPDISSTQATDERIWVTLSLKNYSDYSRSRWSKKKQKPSYYLEHFFAKNNRDYSQRNAIGRLYWSYLFAKRIDNGDPRKHLAHLLHNSEYRAALFERSGCLANVPLLYGIYNSIHMKHTSDGNKFDRSKHRLLCQEIYKQSGRKYFTIFPELEMKEMLQSIHDKIYS